MKLLFIVNELLYSCGVSGHVYNLIKGLCEKQEIEIYLLCGGGNAVDKFKNLGVQIFIDEDVKHEKRSLKGYLKGIVKLYRIVKNHNIGIIHSHHHYAASVAKKVAAITGTKTILTNHGILPEIGILSHFNADYVIAVNEHVLNYLVEKKIKNKDSVLLIRSGMHPPVIQQRNPDMKKKIIAASRFVPEKGLDTYIRAVSLISNEYKDKAEFYIAGEGIAERELQSLNKDLGANIRFLGMVENLSEKFSEFDIFVNPSRSKSEGFPMTLIEAGFSKCIIITSDFYGVDYIFKDNIDGYIFDQNDHAQLASKIKYSIDNFSESQKLTDNFYKKVSALYDIKKMVEDMIKLYNKCLN